MNKNVKYKIMKTTVSFVFLLSVLAFSPTFASAQKIFADKTTAKGRMILVEGKRYIGSDRGDEIALSYYSATEDGSEAFILTMDFDDIGNKVQDGYKLLLKQQSGNIIELTCSVAEYDIKFSPRLNNFWHFDLSKDANYFLTREDIESIISDPVVKLRVEHKYGYTDIDQMNQMPKRSKFSNYVENAYKAIQDALQNKKTGLYDNF